MIQKTRHCRAADNLGRALNNLGDELLDAGCVEEGVEVLRQAVKLNPDMAQIYGNLGRGLTELRDFAGAAPCDEAVRLDPGGPFSSATGPLGRCPRPLGRGRVASEAGPGPSAVGQLIETNLAKCLADQSSWTRQSSGCRTSCGGSQVHRGPPAAGHRAGDGGAISGSGGSGPRVGVVSLQDARPCLLLGLIELQQADGEAALRWFARGVAAGPAMCCVAPAQRQHPSAAGGAG